MADVAERKMWDAAAPYLNHVGTTGAYDTGGSASLRRRTHAVLCWFLGHRPCRCARDRDLMQCHCGAVSYSGTFLASKPWVLHPWKQ